MTDKITIGIDPGKGGGIAWHSARHEFMTARKMPDTLQDMWNLITEIPKSGDATAYLEQVGPAPSRATQEDGVANKHRMGARQAFTFGNGFGHLEMALTAAGIPFVRVLPRKWQTAMSCRTGGDKNVSKSRAQELFPTLTITHATADALLIAEYGRRQK